MSHTRMRSLRWLTMLLILPISVGLALPAPAFALRARLEGREHAIAAGLEESKDKPLDNTRLLTVGDREDAHEIIQGEFTVIPSGRVRTVGSSTCLVCAVYRPMQRGPVLLAHIGETNARFPESYERIIARLQAAKVDLSQVVVGLIGTSALTPEALAALPGASAYANVLLGQGTSPELIDTARHFLRVAFQELGGVPLGARVFVDLEPAIRDVVVNADQGLVMNLQNFRRGDPPNTAAFARLKQLAATPPMQRLRPLEYFDVQAVGLEEPGELVELQQHLRRPEAGAGSAVRFLTGERSYDLFAQKNLPHTLVPELGRGLSALLSRFERDGHDYCWVDGGAYLATALKEARHRFPRLHPVAVDAIRWGRDDRPDDAAAIEREAHGRGLTPDQLWSMDNITFLQDGLGRVTFPRGLPPIRLLTVFHTLSFNSDPLRMLVHLYNQLSDDAYLLANLYIPTNYDADHLGVPEPFKTPEQVVAFWRDTVLQDLHAHGVSVDLQVKDHRGGTNPIPEFQLGLVLQKARGTLDLTLQAHAKPVFVPENGREYQLAWYTGDLDHPFRYSAAGLEAAAQPAATVQPTPDLDTQL